MTLVIQWLWQGVLVAGVAALALRLVPQLGGATRHALLWVALVTVLTLPLAWPSSMTGPAAVPVHAAEGLDAIPHASRAASSSKLKTHNSELLGILSTRANPRVDAGLLLPALPGWAIGAVAGAWAGWILLSTAGLVVAWRSVRRHLRGARALPWALQQDVARWLPALPDGRVPDVRVSPGLRGACAIGFGRPTILVSARLVGALDKDALRQVVLHEHAHLARGDHWSRLAQSLAHVAAGPHPAVRFLLRRLELEREVACDEHVVALTRAARAYARGLVDAASIDGRHAWRAASGLVPGSTLSASGLRVRVERLLHGGPTATAGARRASVAAGLAAATLSWWAAGRVAPTVVFADVWQGPGAVLAPLARLAGEGWPQPAPPPASHVAERPAVPRSAVPAAQRASSIANAPAVSVETPPLEPASGPPVVTLDGRALPQTPLVSSASGASVENSVAPLPDRGWSQAGSAGRAVGRGAGEAGVAVGEAAARSGTTVGRRSKRAGSSIAALFTKAF